MGYDLFLLYMGKLPRKAMGYGLWMQFPCKLIWEIQKGMSYERVWIIPGMG